MNTRLSEAMNFINPVLGNERVKIEIFEKINRVTIDQTRFLVPSSAPYAYYIKKSVLANVQILNQLANEIKIPLYLYLIPQSRDSSLIYSDFDISPYKQLIKANFKSSYDFFEVYTLKNYLKSYFHTDHHWTQFGAYQGYTEIARMMFNEDPLPIEKEYCFDQFQSYGSYSKSVAYAIKADFDAVCAYSYGYKPESIILDGKKVDNYGGLQDYINNRAYLNNIDIIHYERMFTSPSSTLEINSGFSDKPNVLLIGNSFSSPVKFPLSFHTFHLYYYSLEYLNKYQPNFDLSVFIKEKDIDKLIFMSQLEPIRNKNLPSSLQVLLKK